MSVDRFLEWYPRYRKAFSNPVYIELHQFLSSPQSIWAMAQACEAGKPALSGIVKELEDRFDGLEKLIQIIEDEKSDRDEKRQAMEKLGSIGKAALSGVPAIRKALDDQIMAKTAVDTLTQIAPGKCNIRVKGALQLCGEKRYCRKEHSPKNKKAQR